MLYRIICVSLLVSGVANSAQAALVVTAYETGGNVVFSGGGTVSLGDLVVEASGVAGNGSVQPAFGNFLMGNNPLNDAKTYENTIGGPGNFGPGAVTVAADSNTGDFFGINALSPNLYLPNGFTTGDSLSGTSTYLGTTLSALGLTEGTYVWSWNASTSEAGDTLTLIVDADAGPAAPEPSTLILATLGLLSLGMTRRRRRR